MFPVWNCAYPLTANSERHSAAVMTARNLGVGHHFIAAPFIDGVLLCRRLARRATCCDSHLGQRLTSLLGAFPRVVDSTSRSAAFRLLNQLGSGMGSQECA